MDILANNFLMNSLKTIYIPKQSLARVYLPVDIKFVR